MIVARNAGSSTVFVFDWMTTSSPWPSLSRSNPASRIWLALPASPTAASFFSIICIGATIPIANEAITNASQPNVAVFQWLALQRPIRAAMLLDCFRGDMAVPFRPANAG